MPSPDSSIELHSFPTPSALAGDDVEEELRELGFGYRARYVANTAKLVASGGCAGLNGAPYDDNAPLDHLRSISFADAREALIAFPGVGPKVADCIALFGLAHDHVVPIDTHIWKVATRDYGFRAPVVKGKAKATADGPISKEVYVLVQKDLGEKWGPYAGWKQQIVRQSIYSQLTRAALHLGSARVRRRGRDGAGGDCQGRRDCHCARHARSNTGETQAQVRVVDASVEAAQGQDRALSQSSTERGRRRDDGGRPVCDNGRSRQVQVASYCPRLITVILYTALSLLTFDDCRQRGVFRRG